MIEHYLPNKNENATVPKFQLSLQLNTALYYHVGTRTTHHRAWVPHHAGHQFARSFSHLASSFRACPGRRLGKVVDRHAAGHTCFSCRHVLDSPLGLIPPPLPPYRAHLATDAPMRPCRPRSQGYTYSGACTSRSRVAAPVSPCLLQRAHLRLHGQRPRWHRPRPTRLLQRVRACSSL